MSAQQGLGDLALDIVKSCENVTSTKPSKRVTALGTKSMQLALEAMQVKSQGIIEESTGTLKKMLGRVQLWPAEMSPAQGRKSEVKKEVEQWHQELDQIIKRIQELEIESSSSSDENEGTEKEDPPVVQNENEDTTEIRPPSVAEIPAPSTPVQDDPKASLIALFTLASILSTPEKRNALQDLEGERAQSVINFLYKLLSEPPNPSMPWLRKHTLLALRKLCGSSKLYPSWYVLEDITDYRSREDGGMFGDIYSGKQGSTELCLKLVRLARNEVEETLKLYAKEAVVWGQLRHPNIVRFYGVFYLDAAMEKICLVSPWMENGNIDAYLKENPDAPRKPLVRDVALGLEYLHKENIIHGDLKGLNILVDQLGRACIADFGSSIIRVDRTVGFQNASGSASSYSDRWVCPELLREDARPSRASDVWAFGCVCYEILSRRLPFHSIRGQHANLRILAAVMGGTPPAKRDKEPIADPRDTIDDEMWELMNRCWSNDPKARPVCREILEDLERQGVSQREDAMQDTVPETIAGTNTARVNLDEVQAILDEIDTAEDIFSHISEARDILEENRRLSEILSSVLGNPQKIQALQELKEDRAQLLVDFLPLVSPRSFISPSRQPDLTKLAATTLCQLSEALGLYPQRYKLSEMTLDSEPRVGDICDVHRGFHGERPLCIKVFKEAGTESISKTFVKEAIQWARLDHPNILPFYGIHYPSQDPRQFCVVTPWREINTLTDYLEKNPSMPRENFIYDIISGLQYLHEEDIIHGRLKMSNILVNYLGRACITDLGMSTIRSVSLAEPESAVHINTTGQPGWVAPELLSGGHHHSKPCDMWAFGCISYEVMLSKEFQYMPAEDLPSVAGMDRIDNGMQELIRCCLAHEPTERPTAQEISWRLQAKGLRERQEEVRSYLLHRNRVIKTQTGVGREPLMLTERLLRVQYTLYKINEGGIVPTGSYRASMSIIIIIITRLRFLAPAICHLPVTNGHLTHLLSSVFSAQHKRKALQALKGNHAQLMLDFLDLTVSHPDLQGPEHQDWWHRSVFWLSKNSGLFPQSYLLKDINVSQRRVFDDEGDVRKGHYGEQPLHLYVAWIRKQVELGPTTEALIQGAAVWSHLHHPNVKPFYGVYLPDGDMDQLGIVSPWMANGNIREFLYKYPLRPRKPFIYDIAKGLQYLHSQSIIHRNIVGDSVAINDIERACITYLLGAKAGPTEGTVAISSLVNGGFNPSWQAPELLQDEYLETQANDIWQFGCVCYEVMSRRNPYYHISSTIEILRAILQGELPIRPEGDDVLEVDKIDDDMWGLMNRCWAREPGDRPTADQIVEELESWGLGRHEDDEFQNYVLEEHQILRHEMRKYPNVEIDFAKVQEILEEVDALQED